MNDNASFALSSSRSNLGGLPQRLVQDGMVDESGMHAALQAAIDRKTSFVTQLVLGGTVKARDIAIAASTEYGVPLFDLNALSLDLEAVRAVSDKLLAKHRVLPLFKRGKRLFLGVSDPTNLHAIDEIKFQCGLGVEAIVVEDDKLQKLLDKAIEQVDTAMPHLSDEEGVDLESLEVSGGDDEGGGEVGRDDVEDAPIVRFVNKVLLDAIRRGASDIHFEPYEKIFRVRLRMDGVLREVAQPPVQLTGKIAARLKVMSRLDIAERRVPQDGRMKMRLSKTRAIDFRVSSCPTLYGEKIVLRILDPSQAMLGIDALGYEGFQKDLYMKHLAKPQGMILVTGPTGSGKTVSLYTGLNILNREDTNISTAEDPAEINLPGVNQVNVNNKVGLTFASALRAFLRQDPDVVMVGEIRDLETAQIAVQASLTGHLVLSTLHTNTAVGAVTRLRDMGIEPFLLSSSLIGVLAQRLVRVLNPETREPFLAGEYERRLLNLDSRGEPVTLYRPNSEPGTGYRGRTGIYELIAVDDHMRTMIHDGSSEQDLERYARTASPGIRDDGRRKVMEGETTLEEVLRVTRED